MSRPSAVAARRRPAAGRRGTILVVVLALLAIFAVIGIAFVFYSDGEMTAARYAKEAENRNGTIRPNMDDSRFASAAETALASIVFGDYNGQLDGFRGHDLLSAMYGGNLGGASGTHPYTGQGIFHEKMAAPFNTIPSRGHVVNYTAMPGGTDTGNPNAPSYTAFDPELTGPPRAWDSTTKVGTPWSPPTSVPSGQTYVSKAAPYTYPDLNNFYLASIVPGTGETILPSYYRPWHFNAANTNNLNMRLFPWNPNDVGPATNTAANTDWVTLEGRARTLRPRPIDQLTPGEIQAVTGQPRPPTSPELAAMAPGVKNALFSLIDSKIRSGDIIGYPRPNSDGSITGDVMNLPGGVGVQHNDSILVDFGAPAFDWPPGSGKKVKPLAAVMIRDLDGLLHLNAHGNLRNNGQHSSHHGLGPWEVNLGLGLANPAELNEVVRARYGKTGSPSARNGLGMLAYSGSAGRLASASQIAWGPIPTGAPAAGTLQIPTFSPVAGLAASPFFVTAQYPPAGVYDDNTTAAAQTAHPALYNPMEWPAFPAGAPLNPLPATSAGFSYPPADARRMQERYAGDLDLYRQTSFFRLQNPPITSLIGNGATYAPGTTNYRNDPAHSRRLLTTSIANDIDRPRFMSGPTGSATLSTGLHAVNAALAKSPADTLPLGSSATPPPALDLNRPLADYRDLGSPPNMDTSKMPAVATPQPLSPSNMGNAAQAWADRQNLAMDIFARLNTATGGKATIDQSTGNVLWNTTTGTDWSKLNPEDKNAIRYLAQLAVNIVDYIDTDDVSTMFVFRPSGAADLTAVNAGNVNKTASDAIAEASGNIGDYVVFGVEMPRLIINEVYSEIADDPSGKANGKGKGPTANGHIRFWAELVNPTANPYTGGTPGVLGDGSVALKPGSGVTPYKLVITRAQVKKAGTVYSDDVLTNRGNVDGSLPSGYGQAYPDIEYDFHDAGVNAMTMVDNSVVKPNNGKYDPAGNPTDGLLLVGPQVTGATPTEEFDPANGGMPAAPWNNMIQTPALPPTLPTAAANAMEYIIDKTEITSATSDYSRHVVLLRRLANPYLPYDAATNPYVTVDVMDYVPANDGAFTGNGGGPGAGGVAMTSRYSVGRVQPMAGQAKPDAGATTFTYPNSFLLRQVDNGTATQPKHTLGRHNGKSSTAPTAGTYQGPQPGPPPTGPTLSGGETIMAAFDWFVHLDRPLVNELELLHVQAVKPSQVTQYTLQPPKNPTGEDVRRNLGLAPWLGVDSASGDPSYEPASGLPSFQITSTTPSANGTGNGLYRALELLRTKSRVWGTASGGRVAGKVNINTVQDARVLLALLDPQASNAFTAGDVYNPMNPTDPATIWGRFIGSRTRGVTARTLADGATQVFTTTPGKTLDDDPFDPRWDTLDRPFKSFGVAEAGMPARAGGPPPLPYGFGPNQTVVGGGSSAADDGKAPPMGPNPTPFGPGLQDTLLRTDPNTRQPLAYTSGAAANHPYLRAEALRKLAGNVTTVSNTFAVHVTIVYHYTRGNNLAEQIPTPPTVLVRERLQAEAFREVPGDLRQQFFAVVDRSNAMVNTSGGTAIVSQPLQTSTKTAVSGGTTASLTLTSYTVAGNNLVVYSDGQLFTIGAGSTLFIGTGGSVQQFTVNSVNPPPMGATDYTLSITLSGGTAFNTFPPGTLISNGITGRPIYPSGVPNFTPFQTPGTFPHTGLVPYSARVR